MLEQQNDKVIKILQGWIEDSTKDKTKLRDSLEELTKEMIGVKFAIDAFKEDKVVCRSIMEKYDQKIDILEKNLKIENVTDKRIKKIETKVDWLVKNYYKAMGGAIILLFVLNKVWPWIMKIGV